MAFSGTTPFYKRANSKAIFSLFKSARSIPMVETMTSKLNAQDRQDLEKYTRFLAIKATQIIVQSRLGEPVATKCKPSSSGTDWVRKKSNHATIVVSI